MIQWPNSLKIGPLREWPGVPTPGTSRRAAPFSATLSSTLDTLHREIRNLADTIGQERSAELLVAIPAGAFRQDGRPYANAKAEHPGIVFSMDTRHGHVSYPSDSFLTWEDNLRAVALALEALRKVDRYGVSKHGEQYRGYLAIESGGGINDVDSAASTIADTLRVTTSEVLAEPARAIRNAKRMTHPDTNLGNPDMVAAFREVVAAERVLREAGLL